MAETKAVVDAIGTLLMQQRRTLAVAESLTGGLLAAAFAEGANASSWFRGGVVAYATDVKRTVLAVPDVPVVSESCARALARGAAELLKADVAVAVTGVGGPEPQEDQPPGTVWLATSAGADVTSTALLHLDGDPSDICDAAVTAAIDALLGVVTGHVVQDRGGVAEDGRAGTS